MYDNWLFFPPFNFPSKKNGRRKENELAKLVLNKFFSDPFGFRPLQPLFLSNKIYLAYVVFK